jgi:hypothetical protein
MARDGRRYDGDFRGRGYDVELRGYPPRFGRGHPLFSEAHGYDRDFGATHTWSNLRQHARGFVHPYDLELRGSRGGPPRGPGRRR